MEAMCNCFMLFVVVDIAAFLPHFIFETKAIKPSTTDSYEGQFGEPLLAEEIRHIKIIVV